jgi:hypothetical protein
MARIILTKNNFLLTYNKLSYNSDLETVKILYHALGAGNKTDRFITISADRLGMLSSFIGAEDLVLYKSNFNVLQSRFNSL